MAKVMGKVPRGFTRFYVLHLLKEKAMRGKEIIEEAEKQSEGAWRPSPGLIYPLLGRLVRGGLIEEAEDGSFVITPKGEAALQHYTVIQEQLEKQFRVVKRLGLSMLTAGKFLAEESLDRITAVTSKVHETIDKSSKDLQKRFYAGYREFLESELKRLEKEQRGEPEEETE